jgi:hypothetical protein
LSLRRFGGIPMPRTLDEDTIAFAGRVFGYARLGHHAELGELLGMGMPRDIGRGPVPPSGAPYRADTPPGRSPHPDADGRDPVEGGHNGRLSREIYVARDVRLR